MFNVPEKYRVIAGYGGSDSSYKNNGIFKIPHVHKQRKVLYHCIVSDGMGWEHVSVTLSNGNRLPTWTEMCFIKDTFWDKKDTVFQIHPAHKDYVNCHPYCLHLWRKPDLEFPLPPSVLVGPKIG